MRSIRVIVLKSYFVITANFALIVLKLRLV